MKKFCVWTHHNMDPVFIEAETAGILMHDQVDVLQFCVGSEIVAEFDVWRAWADASRVRR